MRNVTFLLLFLIACIPLRAEEPIVVTSEGAASLKDVERDTARDRALENALRIAVEQAVGTMIETETLVENYRILSDRIYTQSRGYISGYEILEEKEKDGLYFVKVRAKVKKGGLTGDLNALGILMERVGKPRVAVMISEKTAQYRTAYGGTRTRTGRGTSSHKGYIDRYINSVSDSESIIMDYLTGKGFHVVDSSVIKAGLDTQAAYSAFRGNGSGAASLADKFGADVLIIGEALISYANIPDTDMVTANASISARAVRSGNGEVIATASAQSRAPHLDPSAGGREALKKASRLLASDIAGDVIDQWKKDTSSARMIALEVNNVTSAELENLVGRLENNVRGVAAVYKRRFEGFSARLDLEFRGTGNSLSGELENTDFGDFEITVLSSSPDKAVIELHQ